MVQKSFADHRENQSRQSRRPHRGGGHPLVEEKGPEKVAEEVDVVTTGTFGPMCSAGAFLSFGHADPPIRMSKIWLNDVPAYGGLAAVDGYIGATELSETRGMAYGGAHVIEDLIKGKPVFRASSYGTDCYPNRSIETYITKDSLNQALFIQPPECLPELRCGRQAPGGPHPLHIHGHFAAPLRQRHLLERRRVEPPPQ